MSSLDTPLYLTPAGKSLLAWVNTDRSGMSDADLAEHIMRLGFDQARLNPADEPGSVMVGAVRDFGLSR